MLIDWFTVGAQALNFVILVWLMKRFLYQPILNAIDAREKRIADELAHADKVSQEASQAKASFERKNLEFDQQREQLMVAATEAAQSERTRLLDEARQTAAQLEQKQQKTLHNKMQELHDSIRTGAQKELFAMAKGALHDLAEVDIEDQMVAVFLARLHGMKAEQKGALLAALEAKQVTVQSSKKLSPDQQATILKSLKELMDKETQLQFEQAADLIGGIELNANGFKIGWSVAEYLHRLEESMAEIDQHITTHDSADPKKADQTPLASAADIEADPETEPEQESKLMNSQS